MHRNYNISRSPLCFSHKIEVLKLIEKDSIVYGVTGSESELREKTH